MYKLTCMVVLKERQLRISMQVNNRKKSKNVVKFLCTLLCMNYCYEISHSVNVLLSDHKNIKKSHLQFLRIIYKNWVTSPVTMISLHCSAERRMISNSTYLFSGNHIKIQDDWCLFIDARSNNQSCYNLSQPVVVTKILQEVPVQYCISITVMQRPLFVSAV